MATHVGGIFTPKGNWDEVPDYQYNDAMIDAQMTALNAVPVHEIGSATAVREFLSLNQKLWELQHLANHWKETRRSENLSETAKEDLCFEAHELMKFVIEELDVKVKRIHAAMYPDADAVAREGAPT
ncbi:hypothetical protein WJ974_00590 [Achromobacter xylosoxidans]